MMVQRLAVITGATAGIGLATARAFRAAGWAVLGAGRREAPAEPGITWHRCDITDRAQVEALAAAAAAMGGAACLVNNAGVGLRAPVERLRLEDLQRVLGVNLLGAIRCTQALLPQLKAHQGTIVQISSVAGKVARAGGGGYSASKFALNALSDALRLEVAPYGVRVVTVLPGWTQSEFVQSALGEPAPHRNRPLATVPAERVARVVLWAAERGGREVFCTWWDHLLVVAATLAPRLRDRVLMRLAGRL